MPVPFEAFVGPCWHGVVDRLEYLLLDDLPDGIVQAGAQRAGAPHLGACCAGTCGTCGAQCRRRCSARGAPLWREPLLTWGRAARARAARAARSAGGGAARGRPRSGASLCSPGGVLRGHVQHVRRAVQAAAQRAGGLALTRATAHLGACCAGTCGTCGAQCRRRRSARAAPLWREPLLTWGRAARARAARAARSAGGGAARGRPRSGASLCSPGGVLRGHVQHVRRAVQAAAQRAGGPALARASAHLGACCAGTCSTCGAQCRRRRSARGAPLWREPLLTWGRAARARAARAARSAGGGAARGRPRSGASLCSPGGVLRGHVQHVRRAVQAAAQRAGGPALAQASAHLGACCAGTCSTCGAQCRRRRSARGAPLWREPLLTWGRAARARAARAARSAGGGAARGGPRSGASHCSPGGVLRGHVQHVRRAVQAAAQRAGGPALARASAHLGACCAGTCSTCGAQCRRRRSARGAPLWREPLLTWGRAARARAARAARSAGGGAARGRPRSGASLCSPGGVLRGHVQHVRRAVQAAAQRAGGPALARATAHLGACCAGTCSTCGAQCRRRRSARAAPLWREPLLTWGRAARARAARAARSAGGGAARGGPRSGASHCSPGGVLRGHVQHVRRAVQAAAQRAGGPALARASAHLGACCAGTCSTCGAQCRRRRSARGAPLWREPLLTWGRAARARAARAARSAGGGAARGRPRSGASLCSPGGVLRGHVQHVRRAVQAAAQRAGAPLWREPLLTWGRAARARAARAARSAGGGAARGRPRSGASLCSPGGVLRGHVQHVRRAVQAAAQRAGGPALARATAHLGACCAGTCSTCGAQCRRRRSARAAPLWREPLLTWGRAARARAARAARSAGGGAARGGPRSGASHCSPGGVLRGHVQHVRRAVQAAAQRAGGLALTRATAHLGACCAGTCGTCGAQCRRRRSARAAPLWREPLLTWGRAARARAARAARSAGGGAARGGPRSGASHCSPGGVLRGHVQHVRRAVQAAAQRAGGLALTRATAHLGACCAGTCGTCGAQCRRRRSARGAPLWREPLLTWGRAARARAARAARSAGGGTARGGPRSDASHCSPGGVLRGHVRHVRRAVQAAAQRAGGPALARATAHLGACCAGTCSTCGAQCRRRHSARGASL
ncbi:unnamed protein product [Euphydryas editha]|uniref:Uncharacterized protein n=1 Tax=Euphydryas editha TaxID=104508 RepID=A0AAU9TT54_EUPED|nr:unnamed protein product [Euphydryas editha]